MKRLIDFYGNVFLVDAIMAIAHTHYAKKNSKARDVTITLRPQAEYIYNPGTDQWELLRMDTRSYDIHFETVKAAAEGLEEMKQAWEKAINANIGQ